MVELKKALCILMVVAGVFVFAGIAGAADCADDLVSEFDKCKRFDCCDQTGFPNVCDIGTPLHGCETDVEGCPTPCEKCPLLNIPCRSVTPGDQGRAEEIQTTCRFDYDDPSGYCAGSQFYADLTPVKVASTDEKGKINVRNCRFFINICECQDACEIEVGKQVGIQMVIKLDGKNAGVNDGVYWAEDPDLKFGGSRRIKFRAFTSKEYAEGIDGIKPCYLDFGDDRFFGDIQYYQSLDFQGAKGTDQGIGRAIYKVNGPVEPYPEFCVITEDGNIPNGATVKGKVTADNRATVLESAADYTLKYSDVEAISDAGKCMWMIDIPAMIIDARAKKGTKISVEVRLLWNKEADTKICQGCVVADVCKCERDIAIVCCGESAANNVGCLFFPYVLQGLKDLPENQSGGWVSGVAISARPLDSTTALTLPKGAYCTLTLRDTEGNTATWRNNDPGAGKGGLVWAFVLDTILPKFDNPNLKPGACSLMVETNYPIDGYTFMNANMQFGAGTLPRGCYGKIAPGSIY